MGQGQKQEGRVIQRGEYCPMIISQGPDLGKAEDILYNEELGGRKVRE
jgi:hypothetical protein